MSAALRTSAHEYTRPVVRPAPRPTTASAGLGLW
jgi:hypothetical protein